MIQDIFPKKYHVEYGHPQPQEEDIVFVFCGHKKREQRVLTRQTAEGLEFPTVKQLRAAGIAETQMQFLFSIAGPERPDASAAGGADADGLPAVISLNYFLLMQFEAEAEAFHPEGFGYEAIRILRCCKPQDHCFAGMTAYQLYDWYRINRFCGCCGSRMEMFPSERAIRCPKCGNLVFPKICPAVIVGVKHTCLDEAGKHISEKDEIVISRYAGREYGGVALLAGFCEIGETPEDTVRREVMEEVGLKVKDIRYYKSQPWGFDSNLLLGFWAEVDGELTITRDEAELAVAEWASRTQLKNNPENMLALTGTMIEAFIRGEE